MVIYLPIKTIIWLLKIVSSIPSRTITWDFQYLKNLIFTEISQSRIEIQYNYEATDTFMA